MAEKQYMAYIEECAVMKNTNSDTNILEEADDEAFESLMETKRGASRKQIPISFRKPME